METEEEYRLIRGNTTYSLIHNSKGWAMEVRSTILGIELPIPGAYPLNQEMEAVLISYEEDGHHIREVHLQTPAGERTLICNHCAAAEQKWFRDMFSAKVGMRVRKK